MTCSQSTLFNQLSSTLAHFQVFFVGSQRAEQQQQLRKVNSSKDLCAARF